MDITRTVILITHHYAGMRFLLQKGASKSHSKAQYYTNVVCGLCMMSVCLARLEGNLYYSYKQRIGRFGL